LQAREELLRKSQAQYFAEAQKLSNTGSFRWNFSSGEVFWSEQTFSIFEYDMTVALNIELVRQRVHPEDIRVFEEMLAQASGSTGDFDIEHRILFPMDASSTSMSLHTQRTDSRITGCSSGP
jgi:hypothetical protein